MKIFISYEKHDSETVARLREQLTDHEVYDFRTTHSDSIVHFVEDSISQVDVFFVVLSPNYLASRWCEEERRAAHNVDNARPTGSSRFIHVLKIADVPDDQVPTLLRDRIQVDLRQNPTAGILREYVDHLAGRQSGGVATTGGQPQVMTVKFRNRGEELHTLRTALQNSAGIHFWVVVAPPQLGKSWFVEELRRTLPRTWRTSTLDLGTQPEDVRGDPRRLLEVLFEEADDERSRDELIRAIAAKIIRAGEPCLKVIDGGDFLDKTTCRQFRELLQGVYELVRDARKLSVRLAVVVASRRHDIWRGVPPTPAFVPLNLTEFTPQVIRDTLREMATEDGRDRSDGELWDMAHGIHRLTEGLPSLVASTVEWLSETQWLDLPSLHTTELFRRFARPYVARQLFSMQSLFPQGGNRRDERRRAVEGALRTLCPYRLITMSHLRYIIEPDEDFQALLRAAGWTNAELWEALGKTALVLRLSKEIWYRIFPATRKVIFRLLLPDPSEQAQAHANARDFSEEWRKDTSGSDHGSIFVESIWHEASRLAIESPGNLADELPAYVRARTATFYSSGFEDLELRSFACATFEDDEDLRDLLGPWPGLSGTIADIITGDTGREHADD